MIWILGRDHPFLSETAGDLARVCTHENAGDLVISGWEPGKKPVSFNRENGAHGGPGSTETRGFAVLPRSVLPEGNTENPRQMRPLDLRRACFNILGRKEETGNHPNPGKKEPILKVVTYNIHSCINVFGRCRPEKIASVLSGLSPDIVALQEVDAGRKRTGYVHQAEYLARELGLDFHFFPLVRQGSRQYGLAVLSRFQLDLVNCRRFEELTGPVSREPRGSVSVCVDTPLGSIRFVNTHLGLNARERMSQAKSLVAHCLDVKDNADVPLVVCGDLNAGPASRVYKTLSAHFTDVQTWSGRVRPRATFVSWSPLRRIDHVFVSPHLTPLRARVPNTFETRIASDHLPVYAELGLAAGEKGRCP